MRFIVLAFVAFILVSLFSALYFLLKDKGQSTRTVKALTIRVKKVDSKRRRRSALRDSCGIHHRQPTACDEPKLAVSAACRIWRPRPDRRAGEAL